MALIRLRPFQSHRDPGIVTAERVVQTINPIADTRWREFLEKHPAASIFHTPQWLECLHRTYGYEPIAVTTSSSDQPISDGIPFCVIASWLGTSRLVALPFSDHCAPLVRHPEQLATLLSGLKEIVDGSRQTSVELRTTESVAADCPGLCESAAFVLHKLDLRPELSQIFRNFHHDCVQRKIHRAERDKIMQEEGRSEALLKQFYRLVLKTRRRHGLPPQPYLWFRNLIACLGEQVKIRIAIKDGRPIAGVLTLRYKQTLTYKYGCSDERFNPSGGIQMLIWRAIQEAKADQLAELDLGRSDCNNPGLIAFKDRWGASRTRLIYMQYPQGRSKTLRSFVPGNVAKHVITWMPDGLLAATGRLLYKYVG